MRVDATEDRSTAAGRGSLIDPTTWAERLVRVSVHYPWPIIVLAILLTLVGGYVTATRFAITTETDQLIESRSQWIVDKDAYEEAFPQAVRPILAVIDGETPELAEAAAAKLEAALSSHPGPATKSSWRPDGGPFFDRNGLMLLPPDQLKATLAQLEQQGPVLQALSGDPTLRGLMRLVQLGAGQGALGENAKLVGQLDDVVARVLRGEPARLSWQSLMSGGGADQDRRRRFVLIDPILDFDALEPASNATAQIRRTAADLGLTQEGGVRVRLTGLAPLADEEFATVREGAPLHLGLTVVAIAVILYLALKSGRIIAAVLATTLAGLVMTVGAGLLMVGRFNVISIAVAALFLGLGVDFGIQVAVRYRDERFKLDHVRGAMLTAATGVGWSLTLAAASLLVGFFSFLPTSFTGVSELGLITGVGMIIAFVASLTLLPALIAVMGPPGESDSVETPWLASVDHWILRHRKLIVVVSSALVVAGLPFLFRLEFDANPMHLRSEKTEAVSTFLDLTHDPGMTPNTISILAPSLDAARTLAAKIAALPEVQRVVTPATFVPDDQGPKLAAIRATATELSGIMQDGKTAPPPTDAELVASLRRTAEVLAQGKDPKGDAKPDAKAVTDSLTGHLTQLADATPERRAAAQTALVGGLPDLFRGVRALLQPQRVTYDTLPKTLRADWLTSDGRARVEVTPKGDANDNEVLERFTDAVKAVAPNVVGAPVDVVESRHLIVRAFATAAVLALIGIFAILTIALRHPRDVALTLGPLVIATIMTLETAYLIGMPLNLANIIALPLMLAVGVNFHIYYMIAWRNGVADLLASSLTRAIFFSSLTTGVAFGSLWLSHHPGTASMGKLLTISLVFTLAAAFVIVPAFLGPPREAAKG